MTRDPDSPDTTPSLPPGLGIAALVLGILALVLSPLLVGAILGIIAVGIGVFFLRGTSTGRSMARWGIGLGLAGVLVGAGAFVLYYSLYRRAQSEWTAYDPGADDGSATPASEWVGLRVPAATLTTLDGERLELDQYRGRPVVLNFWATWCGACRREQPHLDRLAREVPQVLVLRVSDEPESTLRAASQQAAYRTASWPTPPKPFDGVESLPTTVFIDPAGVIADVAVGYEDFESLKSRALGASYAGTPRATLAPGAGDSLEPRLLWWTGIEGVTALAACQWQGDPAPELLAATTAGQLVVLDASGAEKGRLALPAKTTALECANLRDGSARVLAYQNWGNEVAALDGAGQALWSYRSREGINGAHWGDLDADGQVEMIVGMNGGGGLHAVSAQGKRLWRSDRIGNVWGQALAPASAPGRALVVATEAGGSVRVFDDEGGEKAQLRPLGDYFTAVAAAQLTQGSVQILAAGRSRVVAFDPEGQVLWQTPTRPSTGVWRSAYFARGDLAADSASEWVFPVRRSALGVFAADDGRRLAELSAKDDLQSYVVLPAAEGKAMLVIAGATGLTAYRLQRAAAGASEGRSGQAGAVD